MSRRLHRFAGELRRRAEKLEVPDRARDPVTRGLLADLQRHTTCDWMDRLELTAPSWGGWRVVGEVLDGLALSPEERELYSTLTGRQMVPAAEGLRELWLVCGRGSGKTTFLAVQALRAACRGYPVRGVPRVLLLALVKDQAGIAFEYVQEFLDRDAELKTLVSRRTRTSLTFAHGVRVETIASNFRVVRGYSVAFAGCDEIAHWQTEDGAANPAEEIIRALRPGLCKVPGSRLVAATTPWTEEGIVYDTFQRYWGKDADRAV